MKEAELKDGYLFGESDLAEAAAKVRKYAADNGVAISDVVLSALVAGGVLTREDVSGGETADPAR